MPEQHYRSTRAQLEADVKQAQAQLSLAPGDSHLRKQLGQAAGALATYDAAVDRQKSQAARATAIAALKHSSESGVAHARGRLRAACDAHAALVLEREQVQVKIDALQSKAATAREAHTLAKAAAVDALVAGELPASIPELPDFNAALERVAAPLEDLDRKLAEAKRAIESAERQIDHAIACQEFAKIHDNCSKIREHVLAAKQALHRSGQESTPWREFITASFGDSGIKLWLSEPDLGEPFAREAALLAAHADAKARGDE